MVSLAFVLLTVSTLAAHGYALPKDQIIRHECEGNTLCGMKPAGYPQEEIDRLLLKHLPYLQRMKRQAPLPPSLELDSTTPNGNCAFRRNNTTPYTAKNRENELPNIIVQSKWFKQTIPEVICEHDASLESGCFSSITSSGAQIRTKCETKYSHISLTLYNIKEDKLVVSDVKVGVDCACVIYS